MLRIGIRNSYPVLNPATKIKSWNEYLLVRRIWIRNATVMSQIYLCVSKKCLHCLRYRYQMKILSPWLSSSWESKYNSAPCRDVWSTKFFPRRYGTTSWTGIVIKIILSTEVWWLFFFLFSSNSTAVSIFCIRIRSDSKLLAGSESEKNHSGPGQVRILNEF